MSLRRTLNWIALSCSIVLPGLAIPVRAAAADMQITLPVTVESLQGRQTRFALEMVYASLHIKANFAPRPPLRALNEADSGLLDGEMMRPAGIEVDYPNLLRVNVPLYMNSATATVRQGVAVPANVEALSKFKAVGIVRGIRHAEATTEGWRNVVVANNYVAAVRMLKEGMIDVLLGGDTAVIDAISSNHYDAGAFQRREVYSTPLYHYLHKRHAALLPKVQAELAKLRGQQATVLDGLQVSNIAGLPR